MTEPDAKSHRRQNQSTTLALAALLVFIIAPASTFTASGQVTIDFWNPDTGEAVVRILQEDIQGFQKRFGLPESASARQLLLV